MKPVVLEVVSQPPQILGLPDKALIPFLVLVGGYVALFIVSHVVSVVGEVEGVLTLLNGLGWALSFSFVIPFGRSFGLSFLKSGFLALGFLVVGFSLFPESLFVSPFGWMLTLFSGYAFLKNIIRKDPFCLNVMEACVRTPPQRSHLFLKREERRYA